MKILMIFFLLIGFNIRAEEIDDENTDILLKDPNLSLKYQKGHYLLYDCFDKNWVCTSEFEFEACRDSRKTALENRDDTLPCAPIKKFPKEDKKCLRVQKRLTESLSSTRFCKHDYIREIDKFY